MGKYKSAIITTAGQNLFASAIAGEKTVTFTSMQTSSYAYPSTTDFLALTSLNDVVQEADIVSAETFNGNVVQVSSRVDNDGITEAYFINTLGLFAKVESGTPVLVAVITASTPDQMPVQDPEAPSAFIYNIQLTIQSASSITVTVNPAGTATVEMIQGLVKKADLDYFLQVSVPITGWAGTSPTYTRTIQTAVTADSVPFPYVSYPVNVSKAQKRAIDKAASLFTKLTTSDGAITVTAVEVPKTAVILALRGV